MTNDDKPQFFALLAGVHAYHRQAFSEAIGGVYWRGCARWSLEQVTKAFDLLTADPEAGRFLPKIGDVTRVLEGTHTDRSMIAWGDVLGAIGSVGQYQDVVFSEAATHAAIADLGGWPKVCRTELKELGFVQAAFQKAHRAYTGRSDPFHYPVKLMGARSPDDEYTKVGLRPPQPVLVGDPAKCATVTAGGSTTGKTAIDFNGATTLARLASQKSDQDVPFIEASVKRIGGAK